MPHFPGVFEKFTWILGSRPKTMFVHKGVSKMPKNPSTCFMVDHLLKYFVIGLIQGLTEFLPISSSGHLVLLSKITQWEDQGLITDIAVHVGTLLAVIIYLRKEIFFLLKKLIQFNLIESNIIFKITLSTIPAIIVGYFIYDFVNLYFRNLQLVAISSIVFAIILYISDRNYENQKESIYQIIFNQNQNQFFKSWLDGLKNKSDIIDNRKYYF